MPHDHLSEVPEQVVQPDPAAHAAVLVDWYGTHTALAMARFYAGDGSAGAYWSDVLACLTARLPSPEPADAPQPLPHQRPSRRVHLR